MKTIPVDSIHDLEKGDHIKFHRLAFTHHAIVTDVFTDRDEFEVIEMGLTINQSPRIGLKRSLKKMTKWRKLIPVIYKYHYRNVDRIPPEITIATLEVLLENRDKIPYHLLKNNCEHIATFCVTGISSSQQVLRGISAAPTTVATTAVVLLGVLTRIGLLLL